MLSIFKNKAHLIWVCTALFYMYQFILRVSPSVMIDELMSSFHITASLVGTLSSLAMYSYSLLQIPAGLMADNYGVRKTVLGSLLLCILGTLIFVLTPNITVASLGRLLMGAGSASAFLCVSKVSTQWFPSSKRSTLLGITMAMGTLGALNGGTPLSILVGTVGWKFSLVVVTFIGFFIFILAAALLPSYETDIKELESHPVKIGSLVKDFVEVVRSKTCWIYAFTALGIYLSISVVGDLWGVSFLIRAYGLEKESAVKITSSIYIGLCFGSISLTALSDRLKCTKSLIHTSILGIFICVFLMIYFASNPFFSLEILSGLFFLTGFFCGSEMLCFSNALGHAPERLSGTVTGFVNCIVMLGGALIQQLVGFLLDIFWLGIKDSNGVRLYSKFEYQTAFSLVLAVILISAITSLYLPRSIRQTQIE